MITLLPELDKTEVKIESLLNMSVYATVNITKGNGGYKVVSDNPKVTVSTSYGNVHSPFSDSGNALQVQEKAEADNVF